MYTPLDTIPICLINLPERTERLTRTRGELDRFFGSDREFYLVEGVKAPKPMNGIAQAHMNCIMKAKQEGWEQVLIVEDDVRFQSEKCRAAALEALERAPEDWDVLLGGIYSGRPLDVKNVSWRRVEDLAGLHFYIVNQKAYDKLLTFPGDMHYDRWMSAKRNGPGLRCYVAWPFFAIQYDGFSDNVNRPMKYSTYLSGYKVLR